MSAQFWLTLCAPRLVLVRPPAAYPATIGLRLVHVRSLRAGVTVSCAYTVAVSGGARSLAGGPRLQRYGRGDGQVHGGSGQIPSHEGSGGRFIPAVMLCPMLVCGKDTFEHSEELRLHGTGKRFFLNRI